MTAQQPPHAPVRLLIAESSENAAHRFDSLLRDAGIATRPEIVDLPMALQSVSEVDMMLCSAALPELARVLPILRDKAPHVPIIIVNNEGIPIRTTLDNQVTVQHSALITRIVAKAKSVVKTLDPQNDLTFLRIRSKKHEIMVAPDKEYIMIVLQVPSAAP